MMNTRIALAAAALSLAFPTMSAAQTGPRPLDHSDYDRWERIADETLSPNGEWLVYVREPGEGDATLVLRMVESDTEISVARAVDPELAGDGRWVVARVNPVHALVDSLRRADVDDDDLPGDSLVVVDLTDAGGTAWRRAEVESFRVPEEGGFVAYRLEAEDDEEDEDEGEPAEEEGAEVEEEEDEERPRTDPGTTLILRNLADGTEHRFAWATDYVFTDDGRFLYYAASSPEGEADGVYRVATATGAATPLAEGEGRYLGLSVQPEGHRAAFVSDRDDRAADEPAFAVYAAGADGAARRLTGAGAGDVGTGWWVNRYSGPSISKSGERVFFGTAPRPDDESDEDDEMLDDERVVVDIWNWKDPELQPMQLVQLENERRRTYRAWIPFDGGSVIQLESPSLESVRIGSDGDADLALGFDDRPYRQLTSWDGGYDDVYLVDIATGERRLAVEQLRSNASLSPDEEWLTWWDGDERTWYARAAAGGEPIDLTSSLDVPVHDLLDDRPEPPGSYGMAGWTDGDDRVLIYDEFDLWAIDPSGASAPRNVTEGVGRREGIRFRMVTLDPDAETVPTDEPLLLSAFHKTTKEEGFYRDRLDGSAPPERLVMEAASFSTPDLAEDADRLLFTRETFEDFPDLYVSAPDMSGRERLSAVNQDLLAEVSWGSAEIVEWMSIDGIPLQGILYKPDGFDPIRQYPMMVYFYERSSDGLHGFHVPSAGGSSINRSFYVSRGYLLFVPDIPYELGHPGESSLDAVVPGVLSLIDEGFVDPARIGVQGHSWGGYQIAWMLTRTNLFAAAEAGAPVVNMTSAYGGIRWGSGMSRMFQYEQTQSRIGGTLWNAQHLYIQNSPLFLLDKVQTPVLLMHNDEDTAVPWEQGIEMFVALRRLGKPAWLLNYNDEAHGLGREANRKDWAVRMQQFFDHYLMDAPAPVWMEEGVPAIKKGETLGLELITSPETTSEEGAGGG